MYVWIIYFSSGDTSCSGHYNNVSIGFCTAGKCFIVYWNQHFCISLTRIIQGWTLILLFKLEKWTFSIFYLWYFDFNRLQFYWKYTEKWFAFDMIQLKFFFIKNTCKWQLVTVNVFQMSTLEDPTMLIQVPIFLIYVLVNKDKCTCNSLQMAG